MKKKEIAALIGRPNYNIWYHRKRGVIPDPPPGYKTMSAGDLAEYVETCKRLIADHVRTAYERRAAARKANRGRECFDLPNYLKC